MVKAIRKPSLDAKKAKDKNRRELYKKQAEERALENEKAKAALAEDEKNGIVKPKSKGISPLLLALAAAGSAAFYK